MYGPAAGQLRGTLRLRVIFGRSPSRKCGHVHIPMGSGAERSGNLDWVCLERWVSCAGTGC